MPAAAQHAAAQGLLALRLSSFSSKATQKASGNSAVTGTL